MTWEYLAGFFDGEGCISLARNGKSYRPKFIVVNGHKGIVDEISLFIGAVVRKRKLIGDRRQIYSVELSDSRKILVALKGMLPFLRVKRQQAELLIEYLEGVGEYQEQLMPEVIEKRNEFFSRMNSLNR